MTKEEERHDSLIQFWGYGNPDVAGLLLLGIEEGGGWDSWSGKTLGDRIDASLRADDGRYSPREAWDAQVRADTPSRTQWMQAYVSMRIMGTIAELNDPTVMREQAVRYYQTSFLSKYEFQANLYPVPCRSSSRWDDELKDALGITLTKSEYRRWIVDKRIMVLREMINYMAAQKGFPKIVVFGKSEIWGAPEVWEKVSSGLFLSRIFEFDADRTHGWDKDRQVLLLRHPSYPRWFSPKYINEILRRFV